MSDTDASVAPASEAVPVLSPANEPQPLTVDSAFEALRKHRQEASTPPKEPAAPPPGKLEGDDAAPDEQGTAQETAPGDATEATDAAVDLPPIEPPRSWSKEDKALFALLPREVQENTADRERRRENDFNRRQQEAAEKQKAAEAKFAEAERLRTQYEQSLPSLLQTLQTAQSGEFADIKTQDDVNKLAAEDWPRFARYQAHLMQVGSLEREVKLAQERQLTEHRSQWAEFASREDKALLEKAPELSDEETLAKTSKAALKTLKDVGFAQDELEKSWNGEMAISPRDHRFQLLVYEASKYRELKANAAKPAPKPVPPVQRPGIATTRADTSKAEVEGLRNRLKTAKGIDAARIAAQLVRAQRAARG